MAKAKKGVDKSKESATRPRTEAPDGFDEVVSSSDRADGWVAKKEGAIVQGRLIGRTEMNKTNRDGSPRAFYRIELQQDCECVVGTGEESKLLTLTRGDMVNVDESMALQDLEPRTRDGGVYDVWIRYGKQDEQSKFWPADIRLRVIQDPTREATRRQPTRRAVQPTTRRRDYDDRPTSRGDDDYGRPTRDRDDD